MSSVVVQCVRCTSRVRIGGCEDTRIISVVCMSCAYPRKPTRAEELRGRIGVIDRELQRLGGEREQLAEELAVLKGDG